MKHKGTAEGVSHIFTFLVRRKLYTEKCNAPQNGQINVNLLLFSNPKSCTPLSVKVLCFACCQAQTYARRRTAGRRIETAARAAGIRRVAGAARAW
jgi:hypothetical protein